jgi:hypothetical protein
MSQDPGAKRKRPRSHSLVNGSRPEKRSKQGYSNESIYSFIIYSIFQILFIFISSKTNLNIFFIFFRIADQDLRREADTQLETTNKEQHLSSDG